MTSPPTSPGARPTKPVPPATSSMSSAPAPAAAAPGEPEPNFGDRSACGEPAPSSVKGGALNAAPTLGDRVPAPGPHVEHGDGRRGTGRCLQLATTIEFRRGKTMAQVLVKARRREANAARSRRRCARGERRFRQTVMKVDLWSVTELRAVFLRQRDVRHDRRGMIALWMIADAAGIVGSAEEVLGDLLPQRTSSSSRVRYCAERSSSAWWCSRFRS